MSLGKVRRMMDGAVERHQAGDLEGAEKLYRQALAAAPRYPDALRLLGMLRQQCNDLAGAIELLERAVAERPHEPVYLGNLALALAADGRLDDAIDRLRAALL